MTDTDIVTRLAREAGFEWDACHIGHAGLGTFARFAALVAEECAKVCLWGIAEAQTSEDKAYNSALTHAAQAMRARFKA